MLRTLTHRPGPIGLDIGQHGIKMLQLDTVGKAISAVGAARYTFPAEAADDPALRRRLAVEAVTNMLVSGSFRGRRVVTCLRCNELSIKQVRMPRMSPTELQSAVVWEANERFDFHVDPDLLHYLVAGKVHEEGDARSEIILLGAREEVVDEHLKMLTEMGLYPVCLDAEPACLFRSFERFLRRQADTKTVTMLAEVGASGTRVLFGCGRQLKFIKAVPIGGRKLDEAVADALNLPYGQAAELRTRIMREGREGGQAAIQAAGGKDVYRAVHDAVRPIVGELVREINLCLRYCAVTFRGDRPKRVVLAGGEAYDPCLRELIDGQMNLPCELGLPLQGIDVSQVDLGGDHRGPSCEWVVAAGLALRALFTDSRSREKSKHGQHRLSA